MPNFYWPQKKLWITHFCHQGLKASLKLNNTTKTTSLRWCNDVVSLKSYLKEMVWIHKQSYIHWAHILIFIKNTKRLYIIPLIETEHLELSFTTGSCNYVPIHKNEQTGLNCNVVLCCIYIGPIGNRHVHPNSIILLIAFKHVCHHHACNIYQQKVDMPSG